MFAVIGADMSSTTDGKLIVQGANSASTTGQSPHNFVSKWRKKKERKKSKRDFPH